MYFYAQPIPTTHNFQTTLTDLKLLNNILFISHYNIKENNFKPN